MFTIYDGQPSTFAERSNATDACLSYAYGAHPGQTSVITGYQICMLQLGFRAPKGELPGIRVSPVAGGGCVYDPSMPVCWAAKKGWPQHPKPRWSRPNTSRWTLEGDVSICWQQYGGVTHAEVARSLDTCMVEKGYIVAYPTSPIVMWPVEKTWPDCAKPANKRNWIEKKWCPPVVAPAFAARALGK